MLLTVDIKGIARTALAILPSKDDQNRMVQGLGAAALAFWKRQAQQNLRSVSRDYVQGLTGESKDLKFIITLNGVLPNLVENGFPGGDMRKWMLNGPHAKRGKRGKYLIIPFQHGTPGTSERNVGPAMPSSIYAAAQQLAGTVSRRKGGTASVQYGGRLTENSQGVDRQAHALLTQKKKPWHTSSIYQGMIRNEKTFKKAKQTTGYTTFRVISEATIRGDRDAEGNATQHWFHPGIQAVHFAAKTQKHIAQLAGRMFQLSVKEQP